MLSQYPGMVITQIKHNHLFLEWEVQAGKGIRRKTIYRNYKNCPRHCNHNRIRKPTHDW